METKYKTKKLVKDIRDVILIGVAGLAIFASLIPQTNPFLRKYITRDMYKAELRGIRSARTSAPLDKEAGKNQRYLEDFCLREGIDISAIKQDYEEYARNHSIFLKNCSVF